MACFFAAWRFVSLSERLFKDITIKTVHGHGREQKKGKACGIKDINIDDISILKLQNIWLKQDQAILHNAKARGD